MDLDIIAWALWVILGFGVLCVIGAVLVALRWRVVTLREQGERYKRAEANRRAKER